MVATPTSAYRHSTMSNSFSSTQRNSFDNKPRGGSGGVVNPSASPSRNGGGYRGFSGGTGSNNPQGRRSYGSTGSADSQHFFPSSGASPRGRTTTTTTNPRGAKIVTNVNQHLHHPVSSNMTSRKGSDQLAHQKDQWNVERDIPSGTVRNNPFLPQPKPQPPQPVQLMHQKKQWDTSNIPRGSVAARAQVMELESPRNNNGSRLSGGNGTWQPQPIPINLDHPSAPITAKTIPRRSFSPKQTRPHFSSNTGSSRPNDTVNNVTSHSSTMRGRMIETGGARYEEPANAITSPKWEPSREIPKGTVKGRMNTLFGGESGNDKEVAAAAPAKSGGRGYKNFIAPSSGGGPHAPSSAPRNKNAAKQRRPQEEEDDEDPWIIPDRKVSNRSSYHRQDWGEAAVVSAKSAESDDWDAPTKEWFQSESQSSEEDLFEEARPAKKNGAGRPRTEYEGPKRVDESFVPQTRVVRDVPNSSRMVGQVRPSTASNQQPDSTFTMDRDAEILQAAKQKRTSPSPQTEKPRQVHDLIPGRKSALAPPTKDVSAYHHELSPQPKTRIEDATVTKPALRVPAPTFEPFEDSFNQLAKNVPSNSSGFGGFSDASNAFPPTTFTSTPPTKITREQDSFGFPTPTSADKFQNRKQDDEEFFDAIASTKYEGPSSVSLPQKNPVSKQSPGTLKPEQSRSRTSTLENESDDFEEASVEEEPKKKKKGGFFKGLFSRKGKDKESAKSKKSTKQNGRRASHGSVRDQESPLNARSVKSKQLSDRSRAPSVDMVVGHSYPENYPEPRSSHVPKGRSEDDTTISEMTNPTVFKDVSQPSTQNATKPPAPPTLSPIDSKEFGDDMTTPISSPAKMRASKEATTPKRGNLLVDVETTDDQDFVDPELDHLNMDTSEEEEHSGREGITAPKIAPSEPPPPPPPPRAVQKIVSSTPTTQETSRFIRRLREASPSRSLVEEKKDDHDSLSTKSKETTYSTPGRRLSGSKYHNRTIPPEKKTDKAPPKPSAARNHAKSANESAVVTPRSRFRSMSPSSRTLSQSSRDASPAPEVKRSMRSMSPSSRLKAQAKRNTEMTASQAPDKTTDDRGRQGASTGMREEGGISAKYSKKPSFINKQSRLKPTEATKSQSASKETLKSLPFKQKNAIQPKEVPSDVASQSPFARRLAARKSKEPDSNTSKSNVQNRLPPRNLGHGQKEQLREGASRYATCSKKSSSYDSDDRKKRAIVATSSNASDDTTNASGSTYDTYQRKLKESLRKTKQSVPSSDNSVRSNHSNTDYSIRSHRSSDSSIGSDVRVLKAILRRPRLGNNYDEVIKVSQRNEGFQTYDEKTVTDPMQRVGLRLLSGAIIPIQTEVRRFLATRQALTRMWALIVIQTYARRTLARNRYDDSLYAVVTIQRFVRGHNTRVDVNNKHISAIQIQRMVRGYLATMHVYEEIYKVTLVQSWVRMRIAMDDAAYRMALVIQVQAVARGFLERRRLAHQNDCATVIQASWRCFYNRLTYQFDLLDIIIVQSLWRRKLGMREATRMLDTLRKQSAIVIQTAWRSYDCRMDYICYLAARTIQTRWRSHVCSTNYTEYKAARKIQSVWRSYDCRMDYICYLAARMIQSNWRAAVCREEYLRHIAAKMIQTRWRASVCRLDYVQYMAARKIQTQWRASVCRQDYVSYMAARKIQTSWRASVCRQDYVFYLAATVIQARWRSSVCRKDYVAFMAARKIQTNWRSSICRKDYVCYVAARKIQTQWRASVCRQDYVYYMAARKIQTNWRASVCRQDYVFYLAATAIQAGWRSSVCRKHYVAFMAARKIQTNWRSSVCRKDYVCYMAARKIQTQWRASVCRQDYIFYLAATVIQSGWRSSVCRKDYVAYLAARRIQSIWRSSVCRKDYLAYMAARTIQTKWRSFACRQDYVAYMAARTIQTNWRAAVCRESYLHNIAAKLIQAKWRCSVCRKDYVAYMSARKIQTSWRAYVCRRNFIEYFAATIIQAKWRSFDQRSKYICYKAATTIQSAWRTYDCKMNYLHFLADILIIQSTFRRYQAQKRVIARKHEAATLIQKTWRGFACFADYEEYKVARTIQSAWRGYVCKAFFREYLATRKIQATWRGYVCKAYYKETLAARKIQAIWRGFVCYADYHEFLTVRRIQAVWRGFVRRNAYKRYMAARRIQSVWRGFVQFADFHEYLTVRRIQTAWRGYTCRNAYKRYQAATKIQTAWRGCLAFADYQEYLAVRRVQRAWRAYWITKKAKEEKAAMTLEAQRQRAAITIQCAWRGFVTYADYMFAVADVVLVQKMVRGLLARRRYVRKRAETRLNAALTIQKNWRRFVDETEFVVMKYEYHAARTIQTNWRRFWCFSNFIIALDCSIQIQAQVRGYLYRKGFGASRRGAITIQKACRKSLAKQTTHKLATIRQLKLASKETASIEYLAATKIQRIFRGTISRTALKVYLAAVKIQSHVRASQARVAVRLYIMSRRIQKTWRGYNPRRAFVSFVAARRIQNKWRYAKANQQAMVLRGERLAATLIQSAWRGFVCYTDYVFTLSDIVSAQRIARGYLSRKKYCSVIRSNMLRKKEELNAAVSIQRTCRGFQARQKYWYTLGCTMQIQSWWRGTIAKNAVQKQLEAVSTLQCFARRCLARQQYLQRKFIFMLINTAEKEKTKKAEICRMQGLQKDSLEQRRRDEAARVIQRFFLRVKYEVDQLVRAQKRRKKWKKKMMKTKKCPDKMEDSLLEDAWEAAVSRSNLEEEPFTRTYSNMGSVIPMDTRSIASMDHESVTHVETGSIVMAQPVTAMVMDPPGSVASSNLRGSTTGSRSLYRRQQEEMRYRLPPTTIHTKKAEGASRVYHDNDDASVFSQLTGSTMTFARPAHVRVVRKIVPMSEMEDDFQLEEAFIDAEIVHAKERRQMANTSRGYHQSSRAPRPLRKSSGGISAVQHSSSRRVSHDGMTGTNSRGGDSVASSGSHKGGGHRRQPSGSRVLTSHGNY
jgi:IQ calmodulin-binding motif